MDIFFDLISCFMLVHSRICLGCLRAFLLCFSCTPFSLAKDVNRRPVERNQHHDSRHHRNAKKLTVFFLLLTGSPCSFLPPSLNIVFAVCQDSVVVQREMDFFYERTGCRV